MIQLQADKVLGNSKTLPIVDEPEITAHPNEMAMVLAQ